MKEFILIPAEDSHKSEIQAEWANRITTITDDSIIEIEQFSEWEFYRRSYYFYFRNTKGDKIKVSLSDNLPSSVVWDLYCMKYHTKVLLKFK